MSGHSSLLSLKIFYKMNFSKMLTLKNSNGPTISSYVLKTQLSKNNKKLTMKKIAQEFIPSDLIGKNCNEKVDDEKKKFAYLIKCLKLTWISSHRGVNYFQRLKYLNSPWVMIAVCSKIIHFV